MVREKLVAWLFGALLMAPVTAFAANTVLTDTFVGGEARMEPLPGTCGGNDHLAYQDTGSFQVSATGSYTMYDALYLGNIIHNGVDIVAYLYDGAFSPDAPTDNLLTPLGIDEFDTVNLQGGNAYTLVIQQYCQHEEGAWAVTLSGPGNATSGSTAIVPDWTEGLFSDDDPVANTDCGNSQYRVTEPVQVSVTGTYSYADVWFYEVDACLQVFSAPFDPSNPTANRVATSNPSGAFLDDWGTVDLEAGKDYYFVVQPFDSPATGEYFFVLAPPAPFGINKALAGAWFNPDTDGQGILLDMYDDRNEMFAAWFTYDLERPVDGTAQIGEPGHRWLTAFGSFDGASANLDIYWAEGGAFDSSQPPVEQTKDGTMMIEFDDCSNMTVDYDLGISGVTGQVPMTTLSDNHVSLCQSYTRKPGEPGPL